MDQIHKRLNISKVSIWLTTKNLMGNCKSVLQIRRSGDFHGTGNFEEERHSLKTNHSLILSKRFNYKNFMGNYKSVPQIRRSGNLHGTETIVAAKF